MADDAASPIKVDVTRLPRIAPLTYEEADDEARALWDAAVANGANEVSHPQFLTLLRHPTAYRLHSQYTRYLMTSTVLPVRDRELVILRTGWLCGSDTQWYHHTEIGLECGLTREEIDRIPRGPSAEGWSARDATLLRACDELNDACRLGDATWDALREVYDDRQMIELLLLCGNYRTLAYVQGSIGIKPFAGPSPDIPGNRFLYTER